MYLGLDASTQSISAIIIDAENKTIVAEDSVNFGASLSQYNAPSGFIPGGENGEVHADPLMWLDALEILLNNLKAKGVDFSKIKAVSGAGQQHASVYLNDTFEQTLQSLDSSKSLSSQIAPTLSRKTAPIWMDSSTGTECEEIANTVGSDAKVCELSGSLATPRFTGPQIRKFYKEDAAGYEATKVIHLNSSFFASILAGENSSIDTGDGAGMNLMNLAAQDWDSELLEATAPDLSEKLPSVKPAGTVVSNISSYFVEKYGFSSDCQALNWSGDNPASLVGMGASQPGQMIISLGTSDTLFAAMPEAKTDPNGYGHVFGNPMGGYMSLICFANGSLARERVKNDYSLEWSDFETSAIEQTPAGNNGKVAAPFFTPEITPRLNSDKIHTNGWDFETSSNSEKVRALLEGQFLNMKIHSEWMGVTPEKILLTGGASVNNGIAQTISNIFNCPVARLSVSSSVALGSAIRAAVTQGGDLETLVDALCVTSGELSPTTGKGSYKQSEEEFSQLVGSLLN